MIRYTRRAIDDLAGIADYIGDRSSSAAGQVEASIRSSIELLADFPKLGRDRVDLGVRMLNVPKYPYSIYYRIEGGDVWIIHIRDWAAAPDRAWRAAIEMNVAQATGGGMIPVDRTTG